jgi:hypothetical protein
MEFITKKFFTIPPILTKRTTTSHLKQLNTKNRPRHMAFKTQILDLARHKNVAESSSLFFLVQSPFLIKTEERQYLSKCKQLDPIIREKGFIIFIYY